MTITATSQFHTMDEIEIEAHIAAERRAAECGCGGACPACSEHQEWLSSLADEERDEFAQIVESGVYDLR